MQKILLDTNIIIDFLGERKGFYDPAAKIITLADKKKIKIYVSAVSMATAYYVYQGGGYSRICPVVAHPVNPHCS
jgi:predicted nucleic acid-binding protein